MNLNVLAIVCFLFCISCGFKGVSTESNADVYMQDSPIITIGLKGKHDHLTSKDFLCTGKNDEEIFKRALEVTNKFGGGEITLMPGQYHWYTSGDSETVEIKQNNLHIKGISRSAVINIHNNVEGVIIWGSNEDKNIVLEGIVFEVKAPNYNSSVIVLGAKKEYPKIRNVRCQNIALKNDIAIKRQKIESCDLKVPTPYSAIKIMVRGEKKGVYALNNKFYEIDIDGFENGISLETRGSIYPWINGSYFESIFIDNVVNGVNFFELNTKNKKKWKGYNHNTFANVKIQTCLYTQMGFKNLSGRGNVLENCHIWDWQKRCVKEGTYKFLIAEEAQDTYMSIHKAVKRDIKNNGAKTRGIGQK